MPWFRRCEQIFWHRAEGVYWVLLDLREASAFQHELFASALRYLMIIRAAIFLLAVSFAVAASAQTLTFEATPRELDDGDTYVIHLRSQGVDAPEKDQRCEDASGACYPCGQRSKLALDAMIRGGERYRKLTFKIWEVDRFGRPVVTAYADGLDVHLELLRQGWAIAYREYLRPELAEAYLAAEREAQTARRGLWEGRFIEPSKWRRRERLSCER